MKKKNLSGKTRNQGLVEKLGHYVDIRKRVRQLVSGFLVFVMLYSAFIFDLDMVKAWAQGGCGGADVIFQGCALGGGEVETALTNQAVDDVISMYKLPVVDRQVVLRSMRSEVRGMLYVRLLELIKKQDKTPEETQAVEVFANRLKALRVQVATEARNEYNRWTQNACGGYQPPAPYTYNSPGCTFYTLTLNGAPTSPTFEEFQQFGSAIAYQGLYTPEAERVSEDAALAITTSVALTGIGAAGIVGTVIGSTVTFGTLASLIPYAATTWGTIVIEQVFVNGIGTNVVTMFSKTALPASTQSGVVGGSVVGGIGAVVVATIAILVSQTINVVNQANVPSKLNQAIVDAQNTNINLNDLLATDIGNSEVYSVFVLETLPDFPVPFAPPADPGDRPFVVHVPATNQTTETQSLEVRLGWKNPRMTALRLSGTLFAYAPATNDSQRQSLLIRYIDWEGKTRTAYRIGGEFFVVDPSDPKSGKMTSELFMVTENATSQPVNITVRIKYSQMELFSGAAVLSRCGTAITPDPGADQVIGTISDAGEPASSLTVTVNGGVTATDNGVTLRNLRVNSNYEVIGNFLSTNVPPPITANFTLAVRNGIGQERTVPVVFKKTAVLNSLPGQTVQGGLVGSPFGMIIGGQLEVGCSAFEHSFSGDVPPGLRIENDPFNANIWLRGTPASGGKFIFTISKNYANGESVSQTYYFHIGTNLDRIDDAAVSWWRAEDGAADHFKRANGTVVGNITYDTGKVNRGFNFDGGNSYIKLPPSTFSPGNSFTFETWFKTAEKGVILGRQQVADPNGTPNGASSLIYVDHNGKLRVQMHRDQLNRFITAEPRVDDNQYHHVAVTYDWNTEMRRVFLDGVEVGSLFGGQLATSSNYQFGVGYVADGGANTGWRNFKGVIDEPTLYSRALSEAEIGDIYKAGTVGKLYLKIRPYAPQVRDGNDGGFFMDAQGGSPPLKFKVVGPLFPIPILQETSNFMNLVPGPHQLTVTDSLGFEYTTSVDVPNAPPQVTVTAGDLQSPRCHGEQTGSMRVLINGSNSILAGGTQFSVSGGNWQNSNLFTNLNDGIYTPAILDVSSNTVIAGQAVRLTEPAQYVLSPAAFPNAQQNVAYSQVFTLTGNNAPYTLMAEGNDISNNYDLPAGLSASVTPDTIRISGTPSVSGNFPIRVRYFDRNGCQGSQPMDLNIVAAGNVSISGRVTNGGQGLPGATVALGGGASQTTTTDASGNYSFDAVPSNQNYTATVSLNGYSFAQESLTFNNVSANVGNADFLTAFPHYEGDIAPRSAGDGSVDVRDYVALRRIIGNQDPLPSAGGEWQRASTAPRSSLGSTSLAGADLTQIMQYIVKANPLTLVGGPAAPANAALANAYSKEPSTLLGGNGESQSKADGAAALVAPKVSAGIVSQSNGTASVPVWLASDGTVSAVQFTITYDSSKLSLPSVSSGDPGIGFITDTNTPGRINVVAIPQANAFPGASMLFRVNFSVNPAATGTATVSFGDAPVPRLASDAAANAVALESLQGWVVLTGPTSANASIGGRIKTADGQGIRNVRITLTDQAGATQTAVSGSLGAFRFTDVEVGQTYVISVSSKKFTFAEPARVVSVDGHVADLDFIADPM